jgi:hypothetical protein
MTTLGVADGLGHGPGAAEAAQAFCQYVKRHAAVGLEEILRGAHDAMARTRGAAVMVLRVILDTGWLRVSGIGNIDLLALSQATIKPVCVPGILGRRLRKTRLFEYQLSRGDLIAVYSDGVSHRFDLARYQHLEVAEIATTIVEDYGKQQDDATCLVMRYG